jgi:hypothetical protein
MRPVGSTLLAVLFTALLIIGGTQFLHTSSQTGKEPLFQVSFNLSSSLPFLQPLFLNGTLYLLYPNDSYAFLGEVKNYSFAIIGRTPFTTGTLNPLISSSPYTQMFQGENGSILLLHVVPPIVFNFTSQQYSLFNSAVYYSTFAKGKWSVPVIIASFHNGSGAVQAYYSHGLIAAIVDSVYLSPRTYIPSVNSSSLVVYTLKGEIVSNFTLIPFGLHRGISACSISGFHYPLISVLCILAGQTSLPFSLHVYSILLNLNNDKVRLFRDDAAAISPEGIPYAVGNLTQGILSGIYGEGSSYWLAIFNQNLTLVGNFTIPSTTVSIAGGSLTVPVLALTSFNNSEYVVLENSSLTSVGQILSASNSTVTVVRLQSPKGTLVSQYSNIRGVAEVVTHNGTLYILGVEEQVALTQGSISSSLNGTLRAYYYQYALVNLSSLQTSSTSSSGRPSSASSISSSASSTTSATSTSSQSASSSQGTRSTETTNSQSSSTSNTTTSIPHTNSSTTSSQPEQRSSHSTLTPSSSVTLTSPSSSSENGISSIYTLVLVLAVLVALVLALIFRKRL